jgi:hypothetical protein
MRTSEKTSLPSDLVGRVEWGSYGRKILTRVIALLLLSTQYWTPPSLTSYIVKTSMTSSCED